MSRLPDQARALVVLAVETSRRLVGSASTYVAANLDAARSQDGPSASRVLSVAGPLVIPIVVTAILGYTWRVWFRPSSVPKSSTTPAPLLPSRTFRAAHTRPVVFVGASGMGKTVLASTVLTALGPAAAQRVPVWTTRPRLPYETDGIDAYFVSRSTFAKLVSQGFFAEVFSAPSASAAAAVAAAAEADADVDASSASSFTALASRSMDYYGVSQGDLTSCVSQGIIPLLVTPALPQSAALGDCLSVHVTCSSLSALLPALLSHARSVALATFSAALRDPPLRTAATEAGLVSAAAVAHHIRAVHADLAAAAAGAGLHLDTGYSRAWSKGTGAGTGDGSSSTSGNAAATTAAVLGEWVTAVFAACRAYGLVAAPSDVAYNAALAAAVTAFRDTLLAGITEPLGGLYESADSAAFSPSGAGAGAAAVPSGASAQSGHIIGGRAPRGVSAGSGGCAPAATADLVVTLSAASSADAVADVVSGAASGAGAGWGIGDTASRTGSELADAPVRPGSLAAATAEVCDFLALSMPWLHAHASADGAAAAADSDVAAKAAADEEAAEAAASEVKARGGVRAIGSDTTSATAHLTLTAAARAQSRPVAAVATTLAGASASADGAGYSPSSGSGADRAASVYSGTNERQNAPETVPVDSRRGTPSVSPAISPSLPGSQSSGKTDGPAFPALAGGATGAQSVAVTSAPTPASAAPVTVGTAPVAAVSASSKPAPSAAADAAAAPVAATVAPQMTPAPTANDGSKGGVAAAESGSRRNVAARAAVFATTAPSATPAPSAAPARAPAFPPAAASALQPPLSGVAARAQAFAATAASASPADAPAAPAVADTAAAASAGAERRKTAFAANLDALLRAGPPKVAGASRHSLPAQMGQATSHKQAGVPVTPATPATPAAAAVAAAAAAAAAAASAASSRGDDMIDETPQRASNNGHASLAPTPATGMSAAGTSATEGGMPGGVRGEGRIKIKRTNKATKRYDFNANA